MRPVHPLRPETCPHNINKTFLWTGRVWALRTGVDVWSSRSELQRQLSSYAVEGNSFEPCFW